MGRTSPTRSSSRLSIPIPTSLVIVTKVGAQRDSSGGWPHARKRQEIIDAVHDNLRNLGLDVLDVVNLRIGGHVRTDG